MKYFVTSDIHGFYDEFIDSLNKSGFNEGNPNHKLIILGDLFNRGKKPKELQSFVMNLINKDKIILIRGNHEDLTLELIENFSEYAKDIKNSVHYEKGSFQTILDLTDMDEEGALANSLEFKKRAKDTDFISKIIPKMLNYYETEKFVFTHSWVPIEGYAKINPNWRKASEKEWISARNLDPVDLYNRKLYLESKTMVLGHYHCSAFWENQNPKEYSSFGERANFAPFITKEVIAIDARTVVSKRVNVIVLED